jgi:NAD(P)H-hydrate epimerase
MATAGSGGVLTGLLTGLMAQGYTSEQTAIAGAWIHGLAGDRAARIKGEEALIASDIIDYLSEAFTSFR